MVVVVEDEPPMQLEVVGVGVVEAVDLLVDRETFLSLITSTVQALSLVEVVVHTRSVSVAIVVDLVGLLLVVEEGLFVEQ